MARPPLGSILSPALAQNWWVFLVRGLVAIAFGLVALAWPGPALVTLVLFYGVFALIDGVFAVIAAVRGKGDTGARWWLSFVGLLGIVAGLVDLLLAGPHGPRAAGRHRRLGFDLRLRRDRRRDSAAQGNRQRMDADHHGALAILFGIVVLVRPGAGALALVWLIGSFAILSGFLLLAFAFTLKKHARAA